MPTHRIDSPGGVPITALEGLEQLLLVGPTRDVSGDRTIREVLLLNLFARGP